MTNLARLAMVIAGLSAAAVAATPASAVPWLEGYSYFIGYSYAEHAYAYLMVGFLPLGY